MPMPVTTGRCSTRHADSGWHNQTIALKRFCLRPPHNALRRHVALVWLRLHRTEQNLRAIGLGEERADTPRNVLADAPVESAAGSPSLGLLPFNDLVDAQAGLGAIPRPTETFG